MSKKISVVMSVYNAEAYLKESIESILNQTYTDFEFIIINDGSTDNSLEIINSFKDDRIVVINQVNQGLSKSLNNGIKIAKGKLIARMDADDISLPNRINKQVEFLNQNLECVVIGTNADVIDLEGKYLYTSCVHLFWDDIKAELPEVDLFHSSTMFRKNIFEEIGGYNEEILHHFEDKILWNKMSRYGELRNLPDILIKYRLVPNSISNKKAQNIKKLRQLSNKIIRLNTITIQDIEQLKKLASTTKNERIANYYLRLGNIYLKKSNRKEALKWLLKSLSYLPSQTNIWLNIFYCALPSLLYLKLKKYKNVKDTYLNN